MDQVVNMLWKNLATLDNQEKSYEICGNDFATTYARVMSPPASGALEVVRNFTKADKDNNGLLSQSELEPLLKRNRFCEAKLLKTCVRCSGTACCVWPNELLPIVYRCDWTIDQCLQPAEQEETSNEDETPAELGVSKDRFKKICREAFIPNNNPSGTAMIAMSALSIWKHYNADGDDKLTENEMRNLLAGSRGRQLEKRCASHSLCVGYGSCSDIVSQSACLLCTTSLV